MLTVQEALIKADKTELVNSYLYRRFERSVDLLHAPGNITMDELIKRRKKCATTVIDNLINTEINKEEEECILLACHRWSEFNDIVFELVRKEDVICDDWKNKAQGYCYMAEPFKNIAGFYIADTYLTQRNLIDLLVDVIFETSWFGPNQEELEDFNNRLDDAEDEETRPIEDFFDELEEKFGYTPEKRDPREKEAEHMMNQIVYEYNRSAFLIEVEKLRNDLISPQKGG